MLRTLALLALVCLCAGVNTHRRTMPMPDNADLEPMNSEPMPFRAHTEHRFLYNMQIASGLIAPSDEDATSAPQQKAVMRGQCLVLLQFASQRHAQLRLEQCRVGEQNEPMSEPQMVQAMDAFEPKWIPEDKKNLLELPCQFSYEDGVIERVQFHEEDNVWSKNMKRAVLNMVQMNLKPNNQQEEQGIEKANRQGKTYTIPETTLEGACQTSYTIYKLRGEQPQQFNVTKSIDFKQCQQIADVAYGYQTQQQQAKCAQCQQFWTQQQGQQQLQQKDEQHPCAKCDPKEVKEQELDRSTVIRCQIRKYDQEDQQMALKRCELVSQYVYRNGKIEDGAYGSAMQTVVSASLEARGGAALQAEAEQQIPALESGKEESLMCSNQWEMDVKRFYMFGDDEFGQNGKESPFTRVPKVQQAEQALRKLAQAMEDKQRGIEQQAPAQLQHLVEMMRQSTQEELKRIEQNARDAQEKQIFTNALAMCGTRNCVARLAQKIRNKEINSAQALQALLALNQLPAPSDPIVQEIEQLCTGTESFKEQPVLKQSCWLTFGALVNELCQYNDMEKYNNGQQKTRFIQEQQCPMAKKQQYKEAMLAVYKNSDCIYDKMVALNALGNAGLDISVNDLEKIIRDAGEARVVRVKGIDALRRLRVRMPRRIQRILIPIFQNTREHPQVRTAAFSITMYSQPESQLVDQLMYTIGKEPNKQVRAFAYRTMKMMANSQNPNERKIAQHIKAALKVANVDEDELRTMSGKWQMPLLYNTEQREGLFATVAATISTRSALPVYAHAQLDSQFNDQFQHNTFKLYMMQQEAEQWYGKMTDNFKQVSSISRAQRQTKGRHNDKLRNIFNLLGIKNRLADNYQEHENKLESNQNRNQPFAMLCLRTNDVDRGFVAMDQHIISEQARQILNGKMDLPGLAELMLNQLQPYITGAMVCNLNEKTVRIPTSVGVQLKVHNSMPAITNIQGQARINKQADSGHNGIKLDTNMKMAATMAHIQKMECWTPFLVSGVESIRSAELNLPLHTEVNVDLRQAEIGIKIKLPRDQTQLAAIRTLPITYTASMDSRTGMMREPSQMRTIHNPKLERQQRETDMVVSGLKAMGMPTRVQGFFHCPSRPSFEQFVQMMMATENFVRISYEPETNSARELVFRASTATFQKALNSEHPQQMGDFYNTRMDSAYECDAAADSECDMFAKHEQEDAQEMEQQQDRQQQLNTFIEQYKKDGEQYKHTLKLSMQTDKEARAQCEMQMQCDVRMQFCKVQMKADRTPMFTEESRKWTLKADAQLVMPETDAAPMTQQQEDQKTHKQFIARLQAQWGEQNQQKINIRVHGTQAYTAQVRHILQQQQREGRDLVTPRQMEQLHRRTAFLNRFHMEAQYSLKAKAQIMVRWMIEMLKSANFWNTQSHLIEFGAQKEGKTVATVVIDPLTLRHANVTIKTPAQRVRIHQIELPFRVRPFPLIRLQSTQQMHSLTQLFNRFSVDKRAECTADGETVRTFDDSEYASPLMTNCYSVLAKDCGSDQQPQFAVMMKKAQQNAQAKMAKNGKNEPKAIKVMTPEQEIECQPKPNGQSLICWIDGQQVDPEEQQQNQAETVQYNNDQMHDVTIKVEGIAVRFNGRKAWLKVSPMYKSAACGLCGHYDDSTNGEDEWHMADGKIATDLAQFHRSYTLRDTKMCTQQELDRFYKTDDNKENQGEFYRQVSDHYNDEYQKLDKFNKIQDEEQFNGQLDFAKFNKFNAYKNIFGIETNNDKGRQCCCCCAEDDTECKQDCMEGEQCRERCRNQLCKNGKFNTYNNIFGIETNYGRQCCCCCDEDDTECKQDCMEGEQCRERCRNQMCQEEDKMSPVWKTKVSEQHHAVCFSTRPVKQCPRGTMELEQYVEDEPEQQQQKRKQHMKTVRFVCMDRADPEARRLLRSLRQGQSVVNVPEKRGTSFTERVREPQQCRPYREGLF